MTEMLEGLLQHVWIKVVCEGACAKGALQQYESQTAVQYLFVNSHQLSEVH